MEPVNTDLPRIVCRQRLHSVTLQPRISTDEIRVRYIL